MRRTLISVLLILSAAILNAGGKADLAGILAEGQALEKAGRLEEALQLYRTRLAANPEEELYRKAAALLGKLQRYQDGAALLQEGLEKIPGRPSLLNLHGLMNFRLGRVAEARREWETTLRQDPSNAFAREWLAKTAPGGSPDAPAPARSGPGDAPAGRPASDGDAATRAMAPGATPYSPIEPRLGKAEQEKLADALTDEMLGFDVDDLESFVRCHLEMIRKCPDTEAAPESFWRLSNLYAHARLPPQNDKVIEVLEAFLQQHPSSALADLAKNRLRLVYRETGAFDRAIPLYRELLASTTAMEDRTYMALANELADSLARAGQAEEARQVYQQVLARDNGQDSLEAVVAKAGLETAK